MLDVSSHGIMCEGEERDFMNNNTDDNNIDKDNVNTDAAEEIVAEETIFGGDRDRTGDCGIGCSHSRWSRDTDIPR